MKTRKILAISALTFIAAPAAFAQLQQGDLGATSQGQIDLDLQVLDSVEITGLADIDFGTYGGTDTGDIGASEAFCVYVNGADDYTITPTSSNGSADDDDDKFHLLGDTGNNGQGQGQGNGGDQIMYTVKFAGASTGASTASVTDYNNASDTFQGSSRRDCSGSDNAQLHIDIGEQEIRDATTDTYQDTLILTVNPV